MHGTICGPLAPGSVGTEGWPSGSWAFHPHLLWPFGHGQSVIQQTTSEHQLCLPSATLLAVTSVTILHTRSLAFEDREAGPSPQAPRRGPRVSRAGMGRGVNTNPARAPRAGFPGPLSFHPRAALGTEHDCLHFTEGPRSSNR